jgi:CheY-like chemotaxis protein
LAIERRLTLLVLIADDDPETTTVVAAILRKAGYDTVIARDAMQTVALASQRTPDLVLLDIMMPAGTGVGALERLKLSKRTMNIPVIVLSGVTEPERIEQVRQRGAVAFLPKPVIEETLLAEVESALRTEAEG